MPPTRKARAVKVTKGPYAPRKKNATPRASSSSAATPNDATSGNDGSGTVATSEDVEMTDAEPQGLDIIELQDVDGTPPAWAQNRFTLGETLPWFNVMQGGMCHKDQICWGFLIDGDSGIRSYVDDETVITRVGGGSSKDVRSGELTLGKDQEEKVIAVKSLRNSQRLNIPVGLIIGKLSEVASEDAKLPHRYNVMAFFRIADIWCERLNNKTGYRVRFEKINLSELSWWAVKGSPQPVPHARRNFTPEKTPCTACGTESKRVYNEGWICLNRDCKNFWKLNGQTAPANLTYYQNFLDLRLPFDPYYEPHHSLVPNLLSTIDDQDPHFTTSRLTWKGVVCPLCRKCVSRRFWNGWSCQDPHHKIKNDPENQCPFRKSVPMHIVSLRSVINEFDLGPEKQALPFDAKFDPMAELIIDDASLYPYRKVTYNLGELGSVIHFVSNRKINARDKGPNELFKELQIHDLQLQRYHLDQAVVKGTLNSQFTANFGMPYKFVVAVDSFGFSQAPGPILRILGRLKWATHQAGLSLNKRTLDPNELLALGYMEGGKIGYHDDGEDTLGPTIASISLGAPSTMALRMKKKYYHGCNDKKVLIADDPILPGCENYEVRRKLKDELDKAIRELEEDEPKPGANKEDLRKAKQEIQEVYEKVWLESHARIKNKQTFGPDVIKLQLNHGDMMVMHGVGLQKYYEHGVNLKDNGKLRFALTARHVLKDKIDKQEWWKGDHPETEDLNYDGT
ncbi:hypothetical protein BDV12DRAFT_199326 [Aspergillus spectabilis]